MDVHSSLLAREEEDPDPPFSENGWAHFPIAANARKLTGDRGPAAGAGGSAVLGVLLPLWARAESPSRLLGLCPGRRSAFEPLSVSIRLLRGQPGSHQPGVDDPTRRPP